MQPEDIKSYVTIGSDADFSLTMQKNTFDIAFIGLVIISVAIAVAIIFMILYIAHRQTELPTSRNQEESIVNENSVQVDSAEDVIYLSDRLHNSMKLQPREIRKLLFIPRYSRSSEKYIGIYCLYPFSLEDIPVILNRKENNECYIHNSSLNIPSHWKYKPSIYVAYV